MAYIHSRDFLRSSLFGTVPVDVPKAASKQRDPSCRLHLLYVEKMYLLSNHWCVHSSIHRLSQRISFIYDHQRCYYLRYCIDPTNLAASMACVELKTQLATPGGAKYMPVWVWFVFIHMIQNVKQNFWHWLCCKALECTTRRVPLLY